MVFFPPSLSFQILWLFDCGSHHWFPTISSILPGSLQLQGMGSHISCTDQEILSRSSSGGFNGQNKTPLSAPVLFSLWHYKWWSSRWQSLSCPNPCVFTKEQMVSPIGLWWKGSMNEKRNHCCFKILECWGVCGCSVS